MTIQVDRQWSWNKFGVHGKSPWGTTLSYEFDRIPSLWKPIERLAKVPARAMKLPKVNREEFLLVYVQFLLHASHRFDRCSLQREKRAVFVHRLLWNRLIKIHHGQAAPKVDHLLQIPENYPGSKLKEQAFLKRWLKDRSRQRGKPKARKTYCVFCVPKVPKRAVSLRPTKFNANNSVQTS